MRNIKLTIQYDGTDYFGWQTQLGQPSIQAELQRVAKILFHADIQIVGSGRTDRGVHALGQTANIKVETQMPCDTVVRAFNANLADDIAVLKAEDVPENFHARFDAKSKIYRYTILNRPAKPAVNRQYQLHYSYPLDISKMEEGLKTIHGTHDFFSFQGSHPYQRDLEEEPDTVRTILGSWIQKDADVIVIDIEGDGFLYKMVRNIIGVVTRVGSGMIPQGSLWEILQKKDKALVKYTAAANGLALLEVKY